MKRKKFLIAALVLVVAAVVAAFSFRKETDLSSSLPVDMVNEDNQPVAFSDLEGKVLFVNNWASWCPPCIAEMPSIMELKRKLKGVDIEFVMVSFDEDRSKAQAFMDKRKYDFKIYFPGPAISIRDIFHTGNFYFRQNRENGDEAYRNDGL